MQAYMTVKNKRRRSAEAIVLNKRRRSAEEIHPLYA